MTDWTACPNGRDCTGLFTLEDKGFLTTDVEVPTRWHVSIETHGRTGETPMTQYHACYPRTVRTPTQNVRLAPKTGRDYWASVGYDVVTYGGDANLDTVLTAHGVRLVETDLEAHRRLLPAPKAKGVFTPPLGRVRFAEEAASTPAPAPVDVPVVWTPAPMNLTVAPPIPVDPFAGITFDSERDRIFF